MDLKTLKEKRAKLAVPFDGETINCEILPNAITPAFWAELQKLSTATEADYENKDALFLADVMPAWDITADGQPFPPTADNLKQAPIALLGAIAAQVLIFVGKQAETASATP